MADPQPLVTIVIPVRDGRADLGACLGAIAPQAAELGAAVMVVDDGSTDGTPQEAAAHGAQVISLPQAAGPYAARNAGWRAVTSPTLVFTDVRNRAEPGWLQALLAPLDDPGVAVAGGQVSIGGDDRLAHRLARRQSHVDPVPLLADGFLPFVTTSSMAVRRTALERVGGFEERRSGADADLCWRIQQAGAGAVVLAPDSHMVCEPRGSVPAVWQQWRRYARAYVEVRARYGDDGGAEHNAGSLRQRTREAVQAVRTPPRDPALEAVDLVRWLGYELAYRRARRRARRPGVG
jgi:glycosyltransferase involved in cell wall biosynthesis